MRSKIVLLLVAVALGVVATLFAARYLNDAQAEIVSQAEPVRVLVATRDVPAGTSVEEIMSKDFVQDQEIPRQFVADGAVSSAGSIAGLVLAVPLTRGEQLTAGRFMVAEEVGLAYTVPEGHVAISLPYVPARGVSGFVSPGDFVMVIGTFASNDLETAVTKTLVPKARVLAAGAETSNTVTPATATQTGEGGMLGAAGSADGAEGPATLTLALTAVDAERVVFAQEAGTVWYALLASGSAAVTETAGEQYPQVLR